MKMLDIAREYVSININNDDTSMTAMRAARLFDERSGIADIGEINYAAIGRFKTAVLAVGKPVTYNGYLRYLKLLGKWALAEGYWERNWFESVRKLPEPEVPHKTIEPEVFAEAMSFLQSSEALQPAWFWRIVIRFLYFTGVRRRQIVHVQLRDIDLINRVLTASYRGSKTQREWQIPLADEVIEDLQYLIRRNENVLGRRMRPDDYVFNASRFYSRYKSDPARPGRMDGPQFTGFMKRLSARIGMRIGMHRIRHTCATDLCDFDDGESPDLFAAQQILGHTMLSTTRGYVKTKVTRMRMQINKLEFPKQGKI